MGWVFLLLAGALEVGFTTTLRLLLKAPSSIALNVIFVVLIIASFACLQQAVKTVPLGTGYAVWTGIGAVGTVLVGGLFFNESGSVPSRGVIRARRLGCGDGFSCPRRAD
jgi:quaternary ammonium compound-resistance protein SugE